MKREIKFRGKRFDGKADWVYGTYYYGCMYPTSFNGHYINDTQVDPETIGEYTGLKDKNGKEIYEGDVIRMHDACDFEVEFVNGAFLAKALDSEPVLYCKGDYYSIVPGSKILRNIYETPELLNK